MLTPIAYCELSAQPNGLRRRLEARVHGVKVNGEYYRNVLLMEKMLPEIWGVSSDFFIFQQDSAPQHIEQRTPLRCCDVKHQVSLDQNSGQQTQQTSIQLTTEFGV